MVGGVGQDLAHEVPGEVAGLRVGLHVDHQGQALPRPHLDGAVLHRPDVNETFGWKQDGGRLRTSFNTGDVFVLIKTSLSVISAH